MTTGSYSVVIDSYNQSSKSWSGANGRTTENPYSMTLHKTRAVPGEIWDCVYPSRVQLPQGVYAYDAIYNGSGPYPLLPDWTWQPNLELEVLSRLAETIRGHSFNALVFAAELPESIKTVANSAFAFLTALRRLQKGDVSGAVRSFARVSGHVELHASRHRNFRPMSRGSHFSKQGQQLAKKHLASGDISGSLLALRYGWVPLLQDIYEMSNALDSDLNKRFLTFRASKQVRKTTKRQYAVQSGGWSESVQPTKRYFPAMTWTLRVAYKAVLSEHLPVTAALGLNNPASVVWEKIPFSFVVDWFYPLGDYLLTRATLGSVKPVKVVRTTFRSASISSRNDVAGGTGGLDPNNERTSIRRLSRDDLHLELIRSVSSSFEIPTPSRKTLSKAFSLTHLENAGALIHSALSGFRR